MGVEKSPLNGLARFNRVEILKAAELKIQKLYQLRAELAIKEYNYEIEFWNTAIEIHNESFIKRWYGLYIKNAKKVNITFQPCNIHFSETEKVSEYIIGEIKKAREIFNEDGALGLVGRNAYSSLKNAYGNQIYNVESVKKLCENCQDDFIYLSGEDIKNIF